MHKNELKGTLVLILVTLIWGTTFSMSKISLKYLSPFSLLFLRFTLSTISLFLYLLITSRNSIKINLPSLILGIINFLAIAFQTFGLRYTSATKTAFITGISVLLVPFGEFFLLKNKIQKNILVAVVLAFLGLIFLTVDIRELKGINIGDFLVFLCAIFYALQIILISYFVHKGDIGNLAFGQIFITALFAFFFSIPDLIHLSITNISKIILPVSYLGIVATTLTITLQFVGQKFLSPTRSAIIYNLEPVFAYMFANIFLGETLSLWQGVGAILIVIALFISLPDFPILNRKRKV
ncbi:MAG: multidrug ABC transporter permease [Dictyoglomus sp. NZ13-RE01]|nr:MAG: multidrug ABC transporter permease [Dictyoglomus sp. NZ13-RE01]